MNLTRNPLVRRTVRAGILAGLISAAALFAASAQAIVCTWTGPASGGSWDTAANWDCGGPLPGDSVIINNATVQMGANVYAPGSIFLQGSAALAGAGSGATTVNMSGTGLQFGSSSSLSGMSLNGPSASITASPASATTTLSDVVLTVAPSSAMSAAVQLDASSFLVNHGTVTASVLGSGTFNNYGTIDSAPSIAAYLYNYGIVSGTVAFASASNFASSCGVIGVGGSTTVVTAPGTLTLGCGSVIGDTTFNVTLLDNEGSVIAPGGTGSIGTVTVNGNYQQSGDGVLHVDIHGTGAGQFDKLVVSGTAQMGGSLISFIDEEFFTAAVNQTFNVITAGTVTGTLNNAYDNRSYGVAVNYPAGAVQLQITSPRALVCQFMPGGQTAFQAAAAVWSDPANWGGDCNFTVVPGQYDRAEIGSATVALGDGVTTVGDLYLSFATLQGNGIANSTLNVVGAGTIAWGSGANTFQNLQVVFATPNKQMYATSAPLTIDNSLIVTAPGSTVFFAQLNVANCASMFFQNNGSLGLYGDVTGAASPCLFLNSSSGVVTPNVAATISGAVQNDGIMQTTPIAALTLGTPASFVQTAATAKLTGAGNLNASSAPLVIGGGEISGGMTINTPSLTNNGAKVRPGGANTIGTLTISGNYIAAPGSAHEFEFTRHFDGEIHFTENDLLNINGTTSSFDGNVTILFIDTGDGIPSTTNFSAGSSRQIIGHGGATGIFGGLVPPAGRTGSLTYQANSVNFLIGNVPVTTVVTSAADTGAGTLRAVITSINGEAPLCSSAPYVITFAVGSGVIGIQPQSELPVIQCPVVINGQSQPGSVANTSMTAFNGVVNVILNGVNCPGCTGLKINAANSVVKGLAVINWSGIGIDVNCNAGGTQIFGNLIGLDAGGNAHGNGTGLSIENGVANVLVGNSTPSGLNVISGNTTQGIFVDGASTNTIIIGGNLIGLGVNGTTSIGNGNSGYGVMVKDAQGVQLGNNTIDGGGAGPAGKGIAIIGSANGTSILNNGINNTTGGIDLGNDGPTANDAGDADSGPNGLQNYPVITTVTYNAGGPTTVAGTLNSAASSGYRLELFSNQLYSSNNQGKYPSGQVVVSTDASGNTPWSMTASGVLNPSVTATDTTANNTSEFAPMHQTPYSYTMPGPFTAAVGATIGQTITLTNLTSQALVAGTPTFQTGAPYSVSGNSCTSPVAPGASCGITVVFHSNVAGSFTDVFTVPVMAASNAQIVSDAVYVFPLSGNATGASLTTVTVSPTSLPFGNVPVGSPATTQQVTINNTGSFPLNVTSVAKSGPAAADYTQTNTCTTAAVAPGMSCTITVGVTPSVSGGRLAQILVTSNAVGSPHAIALSATGVLKPVLTLSFSPPSIATGAAAFWNLSISNPNTSTLSANSFVFTHAAGLVTAAMPNATTTCTGAMVTTTANTVQSTSFTIPPSGACQYSVRVTSTVPGAYSEATAAGLIVTPFGNSAASNTATLTVVAPNSPGINLTPPSLSFGSQGIGTTSAVQAVVVTSTGNAPLSITGFTSAGDFAYVSDCPLAPSTMLPGATCKVNVTYSPLTAGGQNTFLYVNDNSPSAPHAIGLTGSGIQLPLPGISTAPSSLLFGDRVVGSTSATQIVTVTNPGLADLALSNVTVSGAGFLRTTVAPASVTIPSCGTTVAPQASCFIGVVFAPSATGSVSGDLAIAHNVSSTASAPVSNPIHVTLTGNGTPIPQPVITLSGAQAFGDQIIGTVSSAHTVTIGNTGTAALAVGTVTLGGPNAADFTLAGTCTGNIAPGANCSMTVTFKPATVGAKSAQLSISSNAQNATTVNTVALTGNGVPVPIPVMQLNTTTLGFGNVIYGSFFAQGASFTNSGTAPLQILGIDVTGNSDFTVVQSCGVSLAAGARCNLSVNFAPHAIGARAGTINIRSNADGSPHHIPLTGTGCRYFSPAAARFFLTSC